jgi:hypothetical protein
MRNIINTLVIVTLCAIIFSIASHEVRNANMDGLPPIPVVVVEAEDEDKGNWFTDLFSSEEEIVEPEPAPEGNWFTRLFGSDSAEEVEPVVEEDSKGNWFGRLFSREKDVEAEA